MQLSARGIEPPAIHVDMRLPPDLFLLTRSTIPFSLKYRFTAPDEGAAAMMTLRINNQITESVPLSAENSAQAHASVRRIPLVDAFSTLLQEINVPSIYFNNANTVQFNFDYALSIAGGSPNDCRTVTLLEHQADIDPDSSFDFSGFYHFARMPNLALYAKSGYPFSIHADLSRTLAVLPAAPEPAEVSLLMTALGRIAAQTGAVGSAVEVKTGPTPAELKNSSKDILFIGEILSCSSTHRHQHLTTALRSRARQPTLLKGFSAALKCRSQFQPPPKLAVIQSTSKPTRHLRSSRPTAVQQQSSVLKPRSTGSVRSLPC